MDQSEVSCDDTCNFLLSNALHLLGIQVIIMLYEVIFYIHVVVQLSILSARKWLAHGLVKFVSAVAYHLCLNLPTTFSQPCANHKRAPSRS